MCGIVGLVGPQDPEWVVQMNRVLAHRGPDDQGLYEDASVPLALAMRRLSIVDLEEGRQPMIDQQRQRVVVFNGEIFNAPRLRRDLQERGYSFFTRNSDTEVLLYLYDLYGPEMVQHLNGMFAFVLYDRPGRRLLGARDQAGIKPLYWCESQGRFAFASEIKSLLTLPFLKRQLNRQSLHHYLTLQYIPAPESIFAGISKLPAGHRFLYRLGDRSLTVERYWQPPVYNSKDGLGSMPRGEVVRETRRLLRETVRDWLMSDVSVGCSLSGGLDSSTVVGLMAELGIRPIRTYTLGFAESQAQALDERHLARQVAQRFQTDHREILIRAESLLDDLELMVWHLDEPYAGGLPSWFVFREMSREVKVAMTGTGGDELWGNYGLWQIYCPVSRYWTKELCRRIISGGWKNLVRYPHGTLYHGYFGEQDKKFLWADGPAQKWESTPALRERLWRQAHTWDPRNAVPYIDFQMQLPEEFLLMTDRFSMAWSLEARTPLLDQRLVEFMLRLPPGVRTHPWDLKKLLKDAVRDLLPAEVLGATKSGFVLPVGHWLRGRLRPLVEETLGPGFLVRQGLFSPGIYKRYVVPHLQGQRDNSWQVWTLLMFQLWWLKHAEGFGVDQGTAGWPLWSPQTGKAAAS